MHHTQIVLGGGDAVSEGIGPDEDLAVKGLPLGIDMVCTPAVPDRTRSFGESEDLEERSAESLLPVEEVLGTVVVGSETVHVSESPSRNKMMAGSCPALWFHPTSFSWLYW